MNYTARLGAPEEGNATCPLGVLQSRQAILGSRSCATGHEIGACRDAVGGTDGWAGHSVFMEFFPTADDDEAQQV